MPPKMNYHPSTPCNACGNMAACVGIPCRNENIAATMRVCSKCLRHALLQIDVIHRKRIL